MTEKTNKIKLPKYSSYLTDTDSELLDLFCSQFDCSKAKALPLLLKFWNDNKDKVSNELAIISYEDISVKKYEDRLATIEDKLANISYDTELATIKERLATLENMLATIADNELATISNELANDNELIGTEKIEDNLLGALLDNIHNEETTEDSTPSECPYLLLNEDSPQIVPIEENKPENEDKPEITKEMVTQLLKKHNLEFELTDKPVDIKNTELLCAFFTELNQVLNKKMVINKNNLSKVALKKDNYLFPSIVWEYLTADKPSNKWVWQRVK